MFELAQSNSASTRRILANHDEVRKLGEGPSGQELVGQRLKEYRRVFIGKRKGTKRVRNKEEEAK